MLINFLIVAFFVVAVHLSSSNCICPVSYDNVEQLSYKY